jgi:FkbM family methyltransferase
MLHKSDLEDNIAEYIAERVPKAKIDVLFDVGANIGWFTWQFLRTYPECKCYLFEPVTVNHEKIRANLERFPELNAFPRTQCFRLALGLVPERTRITAIPDVTINKIIGDSPSDGPVEEVEVVTGDAFCTEHGINKIDFLKIDTEGYDLKVLLGFAGMLSRQKIDFVQVEAGFYSENKLHVPVEALDAVLSSFGYRKFRYTNQASYAVPILTWADVVFINERAAQNLAASPIGSVDGSVSGANPYAQKPDYAFWKRAVSGRPARAVDPVTNVPFHIRRSDSVATAGSCFAQHISKTLAQNGFKYLVTENTPQTDGAIDENYGVFPARFGNVYTVRQLLQLLQRAYGLFAPVDSEWLTAKGDYIDPFRPRIQRAGFKSAADLRADRDAHLRAVREMFEQSDVFVFTLGLTEGWESAVDGAVFPLAPGVVGADVPTENYAFHNFTVSEMEVDLLAFIDLLRSINPAVKIILTVSPVALIATFEDRHVLVATTYSKAALRVVAEAAIKARPGVAYFPSYEIITGPQARGQFFDEDLREVTPAGVETVMAIFLKHYLGSAETENRIDYRDAAASDRTARFDEGAYIREVQQVICDENAIDP